MSPSCLEVVILQFTLDEVQVDFNTNGHAVHDAADSLTVAFSECCQCEYVTKCIPHIGAISCWLLAISGSDRSHSLFRARVRSRRRNGHDGIRRHIRCNRRSSY